VFRQIINKSEYDYYQMKASVQSLKGSEAIEVHLKRVPAFIEKTVSNYNYSFREFHHLLTSKLSA
jgi:hypothetical protein